jgi:hypothetical protein
MRNQRANLARIEDLPPSSREQQSRERHPARERFLYKENALTVTGSGRLLTDLTVAHGVAHG